MFDLVDRVLTFKTISGLFNVLYAFQIHPTVQSRNTPTFFGIVIDDAPSSSWFKISPTTSSWYDRFSECFKTRWIPTSHAWRTGVQPAGTKWRRMLVCLARIHDRNSSERCTDQTSICQIAFCDGGRGGMASRRIRSKYGANDLVDQGLHGALR